MRIAISGVSGYTGLEILRILLNHPKVEISALISETYAGRSAKGVFPYLSKLVDLKFESLSDVALEDRCDLIFCALPHGVSMSYIPPILKSGVKVIDLSGDFRLKDSDSYESWYKIKHTAKELLTEAVYGLPEINRHKIKDATLVANPGCYPTSIILPLYPLLESGLINSSGIISDSKSAVSGAGRKAESSYMYMECSEDIRAYSIASKHRHTPEIEEVLSCFSKDKVKVTFTPHLVPMKRGILSTIYAELSSDVSIADIEACYADKYKDERFVRLLGRGNLPRTANVAGTNFCDIGFEIDERSNRLIIVSAIDNLVKGAAGQAVQNMNIMAGFPEETGMTSIGFLP